MARQIGSRAISAIALVVDAILWNGDRDGPLRPVELVVLGLLVVVHLPAILWPHRVRLAGAGLWGYGVVIGLLGPFAPFAGLSVALARFVARSRLPLALVAFVVVAIPFGLNAWNSAEQAAGAEHPLLASSAIWFALAAIPWGIGRVGFLNNRRAAERERAKAIEAREELRTERLRLARELHDIISHSVSAMVLQAAGAQAATATGDPRQVAALQAVETTGVQAMRELHRLLGLLQSGDDEVTPSGGIAFAQESIAALGPLLESVRACDVEVELVEDGARRDLDPSVDHAAYRVIQEALANVIKHAGRGATARIHLGWRPDVLKLDIRNTAGLLDDHPRPDLSSGSGLPGLAERIERLGGTFDSGATADGAFLVRAEFALTEPTISGESR